MDVLSISTAPAPLSRAQIEIRIRDCGRLPSLAKINNVLRGLLHADNRYTEQISDVIRRDPSMTARLLRLVNSAYYGLASPVTDIDEAVFYLGLRQIRQLAAVTPVVEDLQQLAGEAVFGWRQFWQHCIAVAILTHDLTSAAHVQCDEGDYIAGLLHDVGRIVLISRFPNHFARIHRILNEGPCDLLAVETEVLGLDHGELGALYLTQHSLPRVMVEAARFHHHLEEAEQHLQVIAAVQVADLMARQAQIGASVDPSPVTEADWHCALGWQILFPGADPTGQDLVHAGLKRSLERLPGILEGII